MSVNPDHHHRRRSVAVLIVLTACLSSASAVNAATLAWTDKVHPHVLQKAGDSPVEFMVFLDEQVDLGPASRVSRREQRVQKTGRVVSTLREVAGRTQAPLIAILEAGDAEYRPYWIANMIWVRAGADVLERLARRPDVRRIDANPQIKSTEPQATVAQPKGGGAVEWNISHVKADAVWQLGYTGQGVVIGGQDTGYEWDHPAVVGHYRGWDGVSADHGYNWHDAIHSSTGRCPGDSPAPCDDLGHGTHTLGIMIGDDGGNNRIGMAPDAEWIGCRNMDEGAGTPATYTECFEWFVAPTDAGGLNPDPSLAPAVINNSWTCPDIEGCSAETLQTVVENTRAAGIVVVVSAGNSGSSCSTITDAAAIYDASLTVGATDALDVIANFSSRGPVTTDGSNRLKPDVSAPGIGVRSAYSGGGYASLNGTSMSGPHVAGLVALLLSARPDLAGQVDTIEELIRRSAVPLATVDSCGGDTGFTLPNHTYGHGRIDALALIAGDADGDTYANVADCAPLAAEAWTVPGAVLDLRLDKGVGTELTWAAPAEAGAAELGYDALRSDLSDSFAEAICLVPSKLATSTSDSMTPAGSGSVFFYLIRATNACGASLGASSKGVSRSAPNCD